MLFVILTFIVCCDCISPSENDTDTRTNNKPNANIIEYILLKIRPRPELEAIAVPKLFLVLLFSLLIGIPFIQTKGYIHHTA